MHRNLDKCTHAHTHTHTHAHISGQRNRKQDNTKNPRKKNPHNSLQYKRRISSKDIFRTKLDTGTDRQTETKKKTANAKDHKSVQKISSGQKPDTVTDRHGESCSSTL